MHSQERACGHWCKLTNLVSPALGVPYPFYISLRAESTTHPDQYLQTILPRQYWIILNWSVHQTVIQMKKHSQPICSSCLMPEHVLVSWWGFVTLCHTENWTWWAPSPIYHLPLNIEWSGMGDEIEDSGGAQGTPSVFGQKKWAAWGGFRVPFYKQFLTFSKRNPTAIASQSVSAGRPRSNKTPHIASKWLVTLFAMSVESNS